MTSIYGSQKTDQLKSSVILVNSMIYSGIEKKEKWVLILLIFEVVVDLLHLFRQQKILIFHIIQLSHSILSQMKRLLKLLTLLKMYQKCPKCEWRWWQPIIGISNKTSEVCTVCNWKGIISELTWLPPK